MTVSVNNSTKECFLLSKGKPFDEKNKIPGVLILVKEPNEILT